MVEGKSYAQMDCSCFCTVVNPCANGVHPRNTHWQGHTLLAQVKSGIPISRAERDTLDSDGEARMGENNYREAAKNAHKQADQAAESSRQHSRDLEKMTRSGEDARDKLTDGQERQSKRQK